MTETNDNRRSRALRLAILDELAHVPEGYTLPERALAASLQFSLVPPPTEKETEAALERLELDGMISCHASALRGKSWSITETGKSAQ